MIIEIDYVPEWDELVSNSITGNEYIYYQRDEGDFKYLILGGNSSLCAYIGVKGIPKQDVSFNCHGGITFVGSLMFPNYYFWGWDYAHTSDYIFSYSLLSSIYPSIGDQRKKWGVLDVLEDLYEAIPRFKKEFDLLN